MHTTWATAFLAQETSILEGVPFCLLVRAAEWTMSARRIPPSTSGSLPPESLQKNQHVNFSGDPRNTLHASRGVGKKERHRPQYVPLGDFLQ